MGLAKDQPTCSARATAYQLVALQVMLVMIVALGWLIKGKMATFSAALGGIASVLPSFYFARRLFTTTSARASRRIVRAFYVGELVKLLSSAVLVVITVLFVPILLVPFISGFVGAQFGFWLAPFCLGRLGEKKRDFNE